MTLSGRRPKQRPSESPNMRFSTNYVFVDDDAEENFFQMGLTRIRQHKEVKLELAVQKKETKRFSKALLRLQDQMKQAQSFIRSGQGLPADRDSKLQAIQKETDEVKDTLKVSQSLESGRLDAIIRKLHADLEAEQQHNLTLTGSLGIREQEAKKLDEIIAKLEKEVEVMSTIRSLDKSEIKRVEQALEKAGSMLALSQSTNLQMVCDEGQTLEDLQLFTEDDSDTARIIKSQAQDMTKCIARIAQQEQEIIRSGETNGDLELEVLRLRSESGDLGPCTRFEKTQKGETKDWCGCIKCSTYKHLSKKFSGRLQLLVEENFVQGELIKELGSSHPQVAHLEKLHEQHLGQLKFESQIDKDTIKYLEKKAAADKTIYCTSKTALVKGDSAKADIRKSIVPVEEEVKEEKMEDGVENSKDDDDDNASVASTDSIEFIGTDNPKEPKAKSSTVFRDLVKQAITVSPPPAADKSASSESEVSLTVTHAETISTSDPVHQTPEVQEEDVIARHIVGPLVEASKTAIAEVLEVPTEPEIKNTAQANNSGESMTKIPIEDTVDVRIERRCYDKREKRR